MLPFLRLLFGSKLPLFSFDYQLDVGSIIIFGTAVASYYTYRNNTLTFYDEYGRAMLRLPGELLLIENTGEAE